MRLRRRYTDIIIVKVVKVRSQHLLSIYTHPLHQVISVRARSFDNEAIPNAEEDIWAMSDLTYFFSDVHFQPGDSVGQQAFLNCLKTLPKNPRKFISWAISSTFGSDTNNCQLHIKSSATA